MNDKKYIILMLCGFGDTLSAIARLPSAKKKYSEYKICFYLGGFGKSPEISKQQLELEGYEAKIINNLQYHNQLPQIREFLKNSVVRDGDIFEDWSFCEEIFNNQPAINWQYEMEIPYVYMNKMNRMLPIEKEEIEYYEKLDEIREMLKEVRNDRVLKVVAIKCVTKSGNAEGFEHDVAAGRFWQEKEWRKLIDHLHINGYIPMFVGKKGEDWGLIDYMKSLYHNEYNDWKNASGEHKEKYVAVDYIDFTDKSIDETRWALGYVDAGIFCNSWEWEITSRHGVPIPTFCFFTKNHFFIQNHVPNNQPKFWDTCFIQTDNNVTGEQVFDTINYMVKNKKRPEVDYSVAMIAYRDEDTIEKTLNNISCNTIAGNKVVVVHGDEENKDKTRNIIYNQNHKEEYSFNSKICLFIKEWEHDFSLQKNYALSNCTDGWRILLDADEWLDGYTWNLLPWILWRAERDGVDCITLSRVNVLEEMNREQLTEYCGKQGWQLNGYFGNWINFPDCQRRIFGNKDIHYVGKTHEQVVGFKKERVLLGHPIHHHKSKERQEIGLKREHDQYKMKAEQVHKEIYG